MVRLLEALTEPPAADTVAVRTAAAAVEELFVEMNSCSKSGGGGDSNNATTNNNSNSDESSGRGSSTASAGADPAPVHALLPPGVLWGPGTRNRRFEMMLTDAYARSAGIYFAGARSEVGGGTFLLRLACFF